MFSVWHGTLTVNWRYECHSVVSSRRSEPPRRTLTWLFQCMSHVHGTESVARRGCLPDSPKLGFRVRVRVGVSANRDWTPQRPRRYFGVVRVRRCTAERKLTEPSAWWPLFCTEYAVGQAASGEPRDCNSDLASRLTTVRLQVLLRPITYCHVLLRSPRFVLRPTTFLIRTVTAVAIFLTV